ncbi:MAG: 16S rRNA (guanine(966)-N(2))-methyltransferase RsmD [Acidimicrobiia bacterium]
MRVIAGEAGGLRLVAPKGDRTRPTVDRVKESLFSALGDRVDGASVLDLYAGSGALAIEALSRGARAAVLVDRAHPATVAIRANLASTRMTDRARVVRRAVEAMVRDPPPPEAPFHLTFLDPPYEQPIGRLAKVLEAVGTDEWSTSEARIVVEGAAVAPTPRWPSGWHATWERASGSTIVTVLARLVP